MCYGFTNFLKSILENLLSNVLGFFKAVALNNLPAL